MLKNEFNSKKAIIGLSLAFTMLASCASSSSLTMKKLDNMRGFDYSASSALDDRSAAFYRDSEGLSYLAVTEGKDEHVHQVEYGPKEASYAMNYFLKTGELPCKVEPVVLALNYGR